ncbi:hypothetical protein TSMEX_009982, partial [Taenia solium]
PEEGGQFQPGRGRSWFLSGVRGYPIVNTALSYLPACVIINTPRNTQPSGSRSGKREEKERKDSPIVGRQSFPRKRKWDQCKIAGRHLTMISTKTMLVVQ